MDIIRVARRYLKPYTALAIAAIASAVAASFFEGASFGMLIPIIQCMTGSGAQATILPGFINVPVIGPANAGVIGSAFLILFGIVILKNMFTYASNILIARLRFGAVKDLIVRLTDRLLGYDIKFFDNAKTGTIVSNLNNETKRMGDFILAVLNISSLAIRIFTYIVILFLISWKASFTVFIIMGLILSPLEVIMKRLKALGARVSQAMAEYNYSLTEMTSGIRVIKSSGTENEERSGLREAAERICSNSFKANQYIYSLIPISETLIFAVIAVAILYMAASSGFAVSSAFPFIATYFVVMVKALTQINLLNTTRSVAVNNLAAFTQYEMMYDAAGMTKIKDGGIMAGRFSSCIEFRNVRFSYVPGEEVLKDVTISIPRGQMTALVGPSGSGKSTVVNLILRLYDVDSGCILIDGADIKEFSLGAWRAKIGLVSQDVFIFNRTVSENISYGVTSATESDIEEAAKAANAHEFIMGLRDKYDTVLGERGVSLSGGQKQRLSIARAILRKPEILILDEATSSLDSETEHLIREALDRLTEGKTVIAIAHRLPTIERADKIVVLDNGRVVDAGSHAELIVRDGIYRRYYSAQLGVIDSV